jgi:hypothetical protein
MLLQLLLSFSLSHAYIAADQGPLQPQSILKQIKAKGLNFSASPTEKSLKSDLKAGRIDLDPYMPEPSLVALKKEISSAEKNVDEGKELARALIYQAVEKRWEHDLSYTILNEIAAQNFAQFSPTLIETLRTETRFMGTSVVKGKTYMKYQIADWAFVSINRDLSDMKWTIEFNSSADDNQVPDSVKKLKSKE